MKNFLKYMLLGLSVAIPVLSSFGQVSITPDNSDPDPSAMLDVQAADRGVLIPRMTHSQLAAIADPAEGLLVYCTDCGTGALSIFINGGWNTISIACMSPSSPAGATNTVTRTGITWNWNPVPYSTGYRWSAENNFATATDLGSATTYVENGLTSNTAYTRYVWAYNSCDESSVTTLAQTTSPPVAPELTTSAVSGIGLTEATAGGNITFDGDGTITARGVCWATSPAPDIAGSHSTDGTAAGVFSSAITGLSEGTVYYVRAYATNAAGTSYGNQLTFSTYVSDVDGNSYRTVLIGTQLWMAENLRTTKYTDGTSVTYHTDWHSVNPEYAWYNNDIAYKIPYGALYNFPAVNSGSICPTGWHVSTAGEWDILANYTGGYSVAAGRLKEAGTVHWLSPNTGATDTYSFTLLPAGATQQVSAGFVSMGSGTCIWTSATGIVRIATNDRADLISSSGYNTWVKNSVRCVKNQ